MVDGMTKASFIAFLMAGCIVELGPADTEGEASGTSTSTLSMTATTWITDDDTASTSTIDDTATSSSSDGASDETTGPPPPSFDCPPAEGDLQCNPALQDCPEGFKCIPWDAEGDVVDPDGIVCAPIDARPVELYQACTNDVAACTDDCPGGAACLSVFGERAACFDLCDESDACPGDQVCRTCSSCWAAWCVATCDPLAPDCPESLGDCALAYQFGQSAFSCGGPPPGTAGVGEPCSADPWSCGEGLLCVSQEALGPGCLDSGCCTELCSLLDPGGACSSPDHVCIPLFIPGQALPSQEHIGLCALPEAHPCNTPGLCPPPDIDDAAYPWCSTDNEHACDEGIFGFSGGPGCMQGCLCVDQCMTDADCPVPATGTAVPECWDQGPGFENDRCILPCGGGQACPDGMTCAPEWGDICMWVSPDEC
jgi:hypothetical protein